MKDSEKKLLFIELSTLIILFLDIFVTNILVDYYLTFLLALLLGTIIITIGHRKNRQLYEKDIILNILIFCFAYYIITYLSGIFIGFLKSGYNLTILGIIKNILPIVLNIIISEILRYEILSKCGKNKLLIVITCILFIVIDVKAVAYAYDIKSTRGLIEMTYNSIFPIISKNMFLTYLCYKFGYVPNLIYRFFMEVPIYILPIIPNIDDYINTVIELLLPALLFYITYKGFNQKKDKISTRTKHIASKTASIALIILVVLIVILTSGLFKYYALAIGSESMSPNINKGDLVIVEKVSSSNLSSFKLGEVLVYRHNDIVVVHRIVKINNTNNTYSFKTKGDNNKIEDDWTIDESQVIGKAILKIPYIGIPTVWLNEKV